MLLNEIKVHRDDPAMDDTYDDNQRKEQDMRDAPYYVRWTGQSLEWYGDEGPESGEGRYKPKGDGGRFVAINVPTYAVAQQIAAELDNAYQDHKFPDESVYGDYGKDWSIVQYGGTDIGSMNSIGRYERHRVKSDRPKDYSK